MNFNLILILIINSLICLGVHVVTRDGMLFAFVEEAANSFLWKIHDMFWPCKPNTWSSYLLKPLFNCPPCMASVWGIAGWFYFAPDLHLIPYLLVLCGLNALISKLYYYGD